MEEDNASKHLLRQQCVPGRPNLGPGASAWLRCFAGFSWLAYGAGGSVVIRSAPSSSAGGDNSGSNVFQQLISLSNDEGDVKCVAWAPHGANLGVVCGHAVHILAPQNSEGTSSPTDFPLFWRPTARLQHSSPVHAVAWTHSGDALLSAGTEVAMWHPVRPPAGSESAWERLWMGVPSDGPQVLTATTQSVDSLAATAQGAIVFKQLENGEEGRECNGAKRRKRAWGKPTETGHATVWWYNPKAKNASKGGKSHDHAANGVSRLAANAKSGDSERKHDQEGDSEEELQAVMLPHPGRVLQLQWRPSHAGRASKRQVLLTSCEDGIVRLWVEVEVKKGRQLAASDSLPSRTAPRFYVGAIFEPFSSIPGCIYWAEESAPNRSGGASQQADVAACEWLVGVQSDGSVRLWAVHCLDDLHPPRTPRVSKWSEAEALLPPSQKENEKHISAPEQNEKSASAQNEKEFPPSILSCAIQRPEGAHGGPPTAVELCERISPGGFRWARIWPPVAAIGGGGGHIVGGTDKSSGRKTWGFASEEVQLTGHARAIRHVAVHPSPAIGLVASLDASGKVQLWSSIEAAVASVAVPAFPGPFGILSSFLRAANEIVGEYKDVQWVPAQIPVLLALREGAIDVWQVSKEEASMLTSLVLSEVEPLDGFCVLSVSENNEAGGAKIQVVAQADSGRALLRWELDFRSKDEASKLSIASWWVTLEKSGSGGGSHSDESAQNSVEVSVLGLQAFGEQHAVVSLDAVQQVFGESRSEQNDQEEKHGSPFDFATVHVDGSVRFWRIVEGQLGEATCQLAGWTQVSKRGALQAVRVAPRGGRFAVVIQSEGDTSAQRVQIWEGESCFGVGGSFTMEGELEFSAGGNTLELTWADAFNGQLLLAVVSNQKLQVFTQGHSPRRDPESGSADERTQTGGWTCIAEAESAFERLGGLAWGRQLSLLVGTGAQLNIYGPWLTGRPTISTLPIAPQEIIAPPKVPISKGSYKTGSYSQLALSPSPSHQSLAQLGAHSSSVPSLSSLLTPSSSYGSLSGAEQKIAQMSSEDVSTLLEAAQKIGAPLREYHPRVLFHYMFEGNKRKARACLRHLAKGLHRAREAKSSEASQHFGPMRLSELVSLDEGPKTSRLPSRRGSAVGKPSGNLEKDKYASLMSNTWVDDEPAVSEESAPKSFEYVERGPDELFTKGEAEALSEALAMSVDVQGLTSDERVQLLAIIDALAELDGGSGTPRLALDSPAERFRMATRASTLAASRKRGRSAGTADITLPSMQMAWVLHSDTKEALLDACLPEPPTWPAMRALGAGFWQLNVTDLRARVEKAARAQFMDKKDPKDCALLYLALDRKSVLTGLFKLSRDEKDKKLYEFLGRDFTQDAHKAAALKNSYVLMSQHRHELAAAFFLLGGALDEAAGAIYKHLKDPQLALLVCRLKEGPDGPIARELIKREILPAARENGDAWLASLLLWSLGMKIEAMREVAGTTSDREKASAPILDPEVGDYCALLSSKPALQQGPYAKEAAQIVERATVRAAYAYDRAGLQFQALEHLPAEDLKPQTSPEPEPSQPSDGQSASLESGTLSWGGATSSNPWSFGSVSNSEETSKPEASASEISTPKASANPWSFGSSFGGSSEETPKEAPKPSESKPEAKAAANPWSFGSSFGDSSEQVPENKPQPKPASNPWSFGSSFEDSSAEIPEIKPKPKPASNPWSFGSSFEDSSEETSKPSQHQANSGAFTSFGDSTSEVSAPKSANPWSFGDFGATEPDPASSATREADQTRVEEPEDASKGPLRDARTGDGWLSEAVVTSVRHGMRQRLTSQVVSPLLGHSASWQMTSANETMTSAKGEKDGLSEDLSLAAARWQVNPRALLLSLASLSFSQARWRLFCSTSIASEAKISGSALDLAALAKAPGACTPAAISIANLLFEVLPRVILRLALASGPAAPVRSKVPRQQLQEILRVSSELQALISEVEIEGDVRKASGIISLLLLLTAAWFGRRTQAMLTLLHPLLENPPSPITLPSNLSDWFEGRMKSKISDGGKSSTATQRDPLPSKNLVVSEADTWRVLSTCFWSQILGSVRKQLKPSDAQIERPPGDRTLGFGWNSPSQESSHASSPTASPPRGSKKEMGGGIAGAGGIYSRSISKPGKTGSTKGVEDGIVSALASIQTGLKKQLAAHLKKSLEGAKQPPPLIAWLWEPALNRTAQAQPPVPLLHLGKDPKDKEQAQAAALALLNQPKPRAPLPPLASRDPLEEELWGLVVDREKLRAAMEIEGLPAPSSTFFKSECAAAPLPKAAPLKDSPFVNKTKGAHNKEKAQPETVLGYCEPEIVFNLPGELLEAVCVNSVDPQQMVVATNRKGLMYADVRSGSHVTTNVASAPASFAPMGDTLWGKSMWPSRGWPGTNPKPEAPPPPSISPPTSSYVSGMQVQGGVAGLGVGAGTWALGWDVDEGSAEDPIPLLDSVTSRALAAHPLRPFFLVGSNNTHTYLWEFGREKATATYGVLPAVNGPPPYVVASVERVKFDRYGHRFATAANDGTVSTWRLEVGGRSQTRADETRQCFSRYSSDLAFVGPSGSVIAAAGLSPTNENIVLWDTLAPPQSSRAAVHCHDGGARCLAVIDSGGGGYPWIVSGGRGGDVIVHDFRYVASGRGKNVESGKPPKSENTLAEGAEGTSDKTVWSIPHAHAGGVHTIESVPGTSMFVTGGKDGEVKLWDASSSRLVHTWDRAHDKRTFLNARGGGAVMQVAVTLVLPLQDGMLSCGADGIVKHYPQQEISYAKS